MALAALVVLMRSTAFFHMARCPIAVNWAARFSHLRNAPVDSELDFMLCLSTDALDPDQSFRLADRDEIIFLELMICMRCTRYIISAAMVHFLRATWLARIGSTWLKAGWLFRFSCVFSLINTIFLVTACMPFSPDCAHVIYK